MRNGYPLIEAESHERDVQGRDRYFLNRFIGIVEDGKLLRAWGPQRDIHRAPRAEEQLRHVDRLEAVGQLAGGVAHEANNQMPVIFGWAEFVLQRSDIPDAARQGGRAYPAGGGAHRGGHPAGSRVQPASSSRCSCISRSTPGMRCPAEE